MESLARQTENLAQHVYAGPGFGSMHDCSPGTLTRHMRQSQTSRRRRPGRCFRFCSQTPKLKAITVDRPLDRHARELVRRINFGPDHADGGPRSMLLRQLASSRIASECAKPLPSLGFEDVNAHGFDPFCAEKLTNVARVSAVYDGPTRIRQLFGHEAFAVFFQSAFCAALSYAAGGPCREPGGPAF